MEIEIWKSVSENTEESFANFQQKGHVSRVVIIFQKDLSRNKEKSIKCIKILNGIIIILAESFKDIIHFRPLQLLTGKGLFYLLSLRFKIVDFLPYLEILFQLEYFLLNYSLFSINL